MIKIEKSIVIDRPVEEVFAVVSDGSKAPGWQGGLEAVEGNASAVGEQYTEVRKFMGREMRSVLEITSFEPPLRWGARILKGPVPYEVSAQLEPQDGGSRLTLRLDGEPTGFFKVAEGMVKSQLEKSIEEDLQRLKIMLEAT